MSHGNSHGGVVPSPGKFEVSAGASVFFVVMILIGAGSFAFGLQQDSQRAWASFLLNHFYFLSLGLGGMFIAAIHWLTGAMWSAPVRRISESFTAYLPFALVMAIVLYFGTSTLYLWTDAKEVASDVVLSHKAGWLNSEFLIARDAIAILVWIFFAKVMVGRSIAQDKSKDVALSLKNRRLSPLFMIVFATSFTLIAFDIIMSLDPRWFSTMFGVYCFAGLFYSSLALTCLITLYLRSKKMLDGIVNDNHLHDLGKYMFAFTVFWAYIGFSQFMLIWYANLPEETSYFITRFHENWMYVSIFLLVGKFMLPFFFLLPRDAKRSDGMLAAVGIFMMIAQWVDVMWMVQPQFFKDGPRFGVIEFGVTIGFLGAFALLVSRFLSRNSIVAVGDPNLARSVFHHHQ